MKDINKLENALNNISNLSRDELVSTFELVAGNRLSECIKTGINGFESIDSLMTGNNEELTESFLLDSVILVTADENENIGLINNTSMLIDRIKRKKSLCHSISIGEARDYVYGSDNLDDAFEGDTDEEYEGAYDLDSEDDLEEYSGQVNEGNEDVLEDEVEDVDDSISEDDKEILRYYEPQIAGIRDELLKRYTAMFSSGYEVSKPVGLLGTDGLISLSGSELKVVENSASTTQMYSLFVSSMKIKEIPVRSARKMANAIYTEYLNGMKYVLYFPYKLLEFAYGRCRSGVNQDSLKTYKKHADANSWSKYLANQLKDSTTTMIEESVIGFLNNFVSEGKSKKSTEVISALADFLKYMQSCLSVCLLVVEYRKMNGFPSVLKIRICDPQNYLGTSDYTNQIIQTAFVGGTGADPYSYEPRIDLSVCTKEYYHEFNHKVSQSMPLFAYKAYESLKNQGLKLDWSTLILGKAEDGSILRNGSHGVNLESKLTHHIIAGSRAGKGVATLNILAAGAASNKVFFYIDRKPDMSSLLKHIAPDMFVFNGGSYIADHDNYKVFTDRDNYITKTHIPVEALMFTANGSMSWDNLGDLFYMRALTLAMGFILARGVNGKSNSEDFGGKDGVLLVVDEMTNFQDSFENTVIAKMLDMMPANHTSFLTNKAKLETLAGGGEKKYAEYTAFKKQFDSAYNSTKFYALAYMNSLTESLSTAGSLRRAGFNDTEISMSDIFVLGQSAEFGMADIGNYRSAVSTSRIKNNINGGIEKSLKNEIMSSKGTVAYNLVSFRTADALYGWNREYTTYLAQGNSSSKAFGRLDASASNFAYIKDYSDNTRKQIHSGNLPANLQIAKDAVYYKPFLVLNDTTSEFTETMFARVSNAGISREELLIENPDYANGDPNGFKDVSKLNRYAGFEAYITYMGMSNYVEAFTRGSRLMDRLVVEDLGYKPERNDIPAWLEFVTDLRPEWIFSIKDIIDATSGSGKSVIGSPERNPIFEEWLEWDPEAFGGYNDRSDVDLGVQDYDEEISDESFQEEDSLEDIRVASVLGNNDSIDDNDGEVDFDFDEESKDIEFKETKIHETLDKSNQNQLNNLSYSSADLDRISKLVDELKSLGVNVSIDGTKIMSSAQATGTESFSSLEEPSSFSEDIGKIDCTDSIESLEQMMNIVTNDIIQKFGGIERIHSFRVIGGSIIINEYYYRCRIKDIYAKNIPYDIRKEVNSGAISKLFNFSIFAKMYNISALEFDSVSFVYDYVRPALGIKGDSISIDRFFNIFKNLVNLKIGGKTFTRQGYLQESEGEDIFYKPKAIDRYTRSIESTTSSWSKNSMNWAKRNWSDKHQKLWARTLKGTAGITASAASWSVGKVAKGGRGIINSFKKGLRDLIDN